jgi:hypothetical protein
MGRPVIVTAEENQLAVTQNLQKSAQKAAVEVSFS